jgi:hypothetical protein
MTTTKTHTSRKHHPLGSQAVRRNFTRLFSTLAAYCLIFASAPAQFAQADDYTGNDFKKDCIQYAHMQKLTADFSGRAAGYCLGYFTGVLENSKGFCLPSQVVKRQIYQKMKAFLQDEPELLELEASEVIQRAMKDAYPCPHNAPVKK